MTNKKADTLGMYTIAEAARELGIKRQSLHQAVESGRIKVARFGQSGTVVLISEHAFEEYRRTKAIGRPKKKQSPSK